MASAAINGIGDTLVYTGFWTNWSHGPLSGATITLTKRNGGLLTAFIALFVTVVGRSFWRLFCFVVHRNLSKSTAQDGLYHQRQVVLRNADESMIGLKKLIQLAWAWRQKCRSLWLRIIPLVLAAFILTIGFQIASIFSSQISTVTANEVLISSPDCGMFGDEENTQLMYTIVLAYASELTTASASYAQQCYNENASADCSIFVKKQLPRTVLRNASCPFPGQDNVCITNSTNLRIDSGMVDSHDHFGINAPPKDRFTYREILECAPLKTKEYEQKIPSRTAAVNSSVVQLLYGGNPGNDSWKFEWPISTQVSFEEYSLQSEIYEPPGRGSDIIPIAELFPDNADISFFFLMSNTVAFMEPVDDPLFAAHRPYRTHLTTDTSTVAKLYTTDNIIHAIGCTTRVQFCVSKGVCTPLTAAWPAFEAVQNMNLTSYQNASLEMWNNAKLILGTNVHNVVNMLGASALLARNSFVGGVQSPLPDNQWQLEVEHWQATTMAKLQRVAVEYAAGPSNSEMTAHISKPSTEAEKHLCNNQKVKSSSHTSFSVLGLCITLIIGISIIVLEATIEPISRCFQRRHRTKLYKQLEWTANETFQLQRMAHEELGAGTWVGAAESLPTTAKDETLATLELSDETHPRLFYPLTSADEAKPKISQNSSESSRPEVAQVQTPEANNLQSSKENCDTTTNSNIMTGTDIVTLSEANTVSAPYSPSCPLESTQPQSLPKDRHLAEVQSSPMSDTSSI